MLGANLDFLGAIGYLHGAKRRVRGVECPNGVDSGGAVVPRMAGNF